MTFAISITNLNENLTIIDNKQFDEKLIPHYFKSHDQSLSHANPQYHPWPHTLNFLTQTVYPSYLVNILYTGVWKHWAGYRTFWPIFTTLVLLPIYFVYSLVSIYRTFTRLIGQCPAWLVVSTPLPISNMNYENEKQTFSRQEIILPTEFGNVCVIAFVLSLLYGFPEQTDV